MVVSAHKIIKSHYLKKVISKIKLVGIQKTEPQLFQNMMSFLFTICMS